MSNLKNSFKWWVLINCRPRSMKRFCRFGNRIDCTKKQNVANRHRIMLISVPHVLISKPKAFFLVDHQVLKNAQKCSQTNLLASYEEFFRFWSKICKSRKKSGPLIFRILNYSPDMTFFEFSTKSVSELQKRVFVRF